MLWKIPLLASTLLVSCGYWGIENDDASGGSQSEEKGGSSNDGGAGNEGSDGDKSGGSSSLGEGGSEMTNAPCSIGSDNCPWLIFESFENEPAGREVTENAATMSRSFELSRTGRAMRVEQGGSASQAEIRVTIDTLAKEITYFRTWLFVPKQSVNGRIKVLGLNDSRGVSTDVNLAPDGRTEIYLETTDERATSAKHAYLEGEWFCLEASTLIDNQAGWMRVEIDGKLATEIVNADTRPGSGVSIVVYGMAATEDGQQGGLLYFDDVAMANEPIGCN